MKNWMHTQEYAALCRQDQDHQSHVRVYWCHRFDLTAEKSRSKQAEFNPQGCYNGVKGWYEKGFVSPTEPRYPSFEEDPAAYMGD